MRYGPIPDSPEEQSALDQSAQIRVLLDPFLPLATSIGLMAFVRLGAARCLSSGAQTTADLSAVLDLREDGLRHLLRLMVASGYATIERGSEGAGVQTKYALSPLSEATLLQDGSAALDAWVLHNQVHLRVLSTLEETLTSGGVRDLHHHLGSAEAWADYQRAMLQTARPIAGQVAQLVPEPQGRALLLDLGGSHGLYGAEICRRFAPMRSRVVDLPDAIVHARKLNRSEGISDLVDYIEGDFSQIAFGTAVYDFVFLGSVLHHLEDDAVPDLLNRIYNALKPGGVIAIWDMAPPPDKPELDLVAEAFSLMFYLSSASACRAPEELCRSLAAAGFCDQRVQPGSPMNHVLVSGHK